MAIVSLFIDSPRGRLGPIRAHRAGLDSEISVLIEPNECAADRVIDIDGVADDGRVIALLGQAPPGSNTPRRMYFSDASRLVYPSKRPPTLEGSSGILPIASPTSFGPQRTQNPRASRAGSSRSTSNCTTATGNRWARNGGIRPMAPGLASTLNSETLPSVAA